MVGVAVPVVDLGGCGETVLAEAVFGAELGEQDSVRGGFESSGGEGDGLSRAGHRAFEDELAGWGEG